MKKLSVFLCLACIWVCSLQAQQAKNCFINMPDSLSPLLTSVNRADCVDFLESKMKAEVTNRFGGKSEMTEFSADYIRMQMSPQSTWQMKLLAMNDSVQVICVVSTACAPVCDSDIRFYTTGWKELPASSFLKLPQEVSAFFDMEKLLSMPVLLADSLSVSVLDNSSDYAVVDAIRKADMLLMKADFTSKSDTLTFTFTTPEYMEKEAAATLDPYIHCSAAYVWKEGQFVLSLPN